MKTLKLMYVIYAIYIAGLIGWCMSIVKLCRCDFEPSYKAEIIYGVSAITGIGAITGYMDFGK